MILDCLVVKLDGEVEAAQLTGHELVALDRDPQVAVVAPVMAVRDLAVGGSVIVDAGVWGTRPEPRGAEVTVAVLGAMALPPLARSVTTLRRPVLDAHGHATTAQLAEALVDVARLGTQVALVTIDCDVPATIAGLVARGYAPPAAMATAVAHLVANADALAAVLARRAELLVVAPVGDDSRRGPDVPGGPVLVPATMIARLPRVLGVGAVTAHRAGLIVAPTSNLFPTLVAPGDSGAGACATTVAAARVAALATRWWGAAPRGTVADVVRTQMIAAATQGSFAAPPDPAEVGAGLAQPPR
ncbi:MAG: hypothetical protein KBG48_09320 [Kofleriaceae bacterium]|nr:hypothetical protein [Kofleriaceae bacterium]MBP9167576.1 hypothetical protein [Kofleriaceae bacterium]MBP9856658.1 hypothetical protein [Kofleriaceae bacterium]